NSRVTVRAAAVTGAQSIDVQGMPAAGRDVAERVLRSALLGKVVRVGDSVTLLPRDLGPDFPTADAARTLRSRLGMQWSTTLLTVTATAPDGVVSVQPTTDVRPAGTAGPRSAVGPATGSGAGPAATGAGTGSEATTTRSASAPAGATARAARGRGDGLARPHRTVDRRGRRRGPGGRRRPRGGAGPVAGAGAGPRGSAALSRRLPAPRRAGGGPAGRRQGDVRAVGSGRTE